MQSGRAFRAWSDLQLLRAQLVGSSPRCAPLAAVLNAIREISATPGHQDHKSNSTAAQDKEPVDIGAFSARWNTARSALTTCVSEAAGCTAEEQGRIDEQVNELVASRDTLLDQLLPIVQAEEARLQALLTAPEAQRKKLQDLRSVANSLQADLALRTVVSRLKTNGQS